MGYDEVIPLLGDFGRYQRRIYFLLRLSGILSAFHILGKVFLQATPDHRCRLIDELPNASYVLPEEILNVSFPFDEKNQEYSSCSMIQDNEIVSCDGYIYDDQKYSSTVVTEIRKKINLFLVPNHSSFFGFAAAFSPEYSTYTICRAIIGARTYGLYLSAYVIAVELVGPGSRSIAGIVNHMFFSLGYMLTTALAYLTIDWRHLQLALTLPAVLYFSYWWFIPESVCWLLTKNRIPEATKLIQIVAKENKVTISEIQLQQLLIGNQKDQLEKQATICENFQHPSLKRRVLIIRFDWFVVGMTYYGLSWNTSNLGGNDHLNFVISGAVEIPAYTFLVFTLNRFGRRSILCGCFVTTGASLLLTTAVPEDQQWLLTTLVMLGKLAITASSGTVYIFSTEQFPTVIRNAGLGAGAVSGKIGSILAPSINLTGVIWKPTPLIVFGTLALISGGISLVLPEILNQQLPQTMDD